MRRRSMKHPPATLLINAKKLRSSYEKLFQDLYEHDHSSDEASDDEVSDDARMYQERRDKEYAAL